MADLLPSSRDPDAGDGGEPRVIGVDSEDADDLLAAIQSETARDLLAELYDDPATPSELADGLDTSIQNVRYHLERLSDADLVEVADTVYSEKGREMKVYAPAARPLVVFAGGEDDAPGLETALSRLLGALGVLGLSSLAIQRIFGDGSPVPTPSFGTGGAGGASDAAATTARPETTAESADAGGPNDGVVTENESSGQNLTYDGTETVADGVRTTPKGSEEIGGETTRSAADTTQTAAETGRTVTEEATTVAEETTVAETTQNVAETTRTVTEDAAARTIEATAETTTTVADAAGAATSGLPPGLLFFAGGVVVLLALGVAWYLRAR